MISEAVAMAACHHIYLIPGMFGFGRLTGFEYFGHVERALTERFEAAGVESYVDVVPTPPTASIRRRAHVLADEIDRTASTKARDPVHLVGHSTGGLDARLLASPSVDLHHPDGALQWRRRLQSIATMNTPHYGTPLAQFFATVSGTRLLYALSLLTVTTLSVGRTPLGAASAIVAAAGRLDEALGLDIRLLNRATETLLRFLGEEGREEVRDWLDGIQQDQGGVIQLSPEAMDLFNAAAEDADDVRYGAMASSAPPPRPLRFAASVRSPYAAVSATIYSTLYTIASRVHRHYPYPTPDPDTAEDLRQGIGRVADQSFNDGVVPTLSQVWGELIWAGGADHLDVLGHFGDDERPPVHTDWLACGAGFHRREFATAMDRLAGFLLRQT